MIGRRRLLTLTAAGISAGDARRSRRHAPGACRRHDPLGIAARHDRGARRLSLLGRQEVRLFRRHRDDARAGPVRRDGDASSWSTRTRPMSAIPSPGVFSLGLAQGIPLVSVFEMGGADVFDFAFRKGEAPADIKGLEGKTIVLGSAGWQSIADPMLKAAGVDITKVKYVDAGWPTWGTALMSGQGRRGAVVGRPARPVEGPGPRLRLHPRPQLLEAAGQQLRHPQGGLRGRGEAGQSTPATSRAGRPASSSASSTRAPRRRSSWSSSRASPRR